MVSAQTRVYLRYELWLELGLGVLQREWKLQIPRAIKHPLATQRHSREVAPTLEDHFITNPFPNRATGWGLQDRPLDGSWEITSETLEYVF